MRDGICFCFTVPPTLPNAMNTRIPFALSLPFGPWTWRVLAAVPSGSLFRGTNHRAKSSSPRLRIGLTARRERAFHNILSYSTY